MRVPNPSPALGVGVTGVRSTSGPPVRCCCCRGGAGVAGAPGVTGPAVMGVEYGQGFGVITARGSEHCDTFIPDHDKAPPIGTSTNRHGGMLGGISSGLPIVMRCAIKPTSSIPQDRPTVDNEGNETTIATKGRHDPCLLPRFVPMGEAMMALVLVDHMLRQRAISAMD